MPDKFIICREWGGGFWSDMDHVFAALLIAEITGRIPIIYWGACSKYRSEGPGNAFDIYWQSISPFTLDDITQINEATVFPKSWAGRPLDDDVSVEIMSSRTQRDSGIDLLSREETIIVSDTHIRPINLMPHIPTNHLLSSLDAAGVYRALWQKYLKPQPEIEQSVDVFCEKHFKGHQYIAVHIRGSDKHKEWGPLIKESNKRYVDALKSFRNNEAWRIFLMTESQSIFDEYIALFGDQIVSSECHRTSDDTGPHFGRLASGEILGREVLLDTLVATRANMFLGTGASNVSRAIDVYKDWPPGHKQLVVKNLWLYSGE